MWGTATTLARAGAEGHLTLKKLSAGKTFFGHVMYQDAELPL